VEARTGQLSGGLRASGAYLLTGSLAGVNAAIPGYPGFAAQALRYTLATIVLATACWVQGRRHPLDGQRIRLTRRVVWGAGTIGQADTPGVVLGVALPISGGAGAARTRQRKKKDTAAAPQQSRTRTGAPRA
jgi:hypothetical protein